MRISCDQNHLILEIKTSTFKHSDYENVAEGSGLESSDYYISPSYLDSYDSPSYDYEYGPQGGSSFTTVLCDTDSNEACVTINQCSNEGKTKGWRFIDNALIKKFDILMV